MWTVVGGLATIALAGMTGYSVYDIISSGSYQNWSIWDWLFNIGTTLFGFYPFLSGVKVASVAKVGLFTRILNWLENIPFVGKFFGVLFTIKNLFVKTYDNIFGKLLAKGGFLFEGGKALSALAKLVKHPILLFGLIASSSLFDGILQTIFRLLGNLTLKLADTMWKAISTSGVENPSGDIAQVVTQSAQGLPPCVTAMWGACGASVCVGMVLATLEYILLLNAIAKGYYFYSRGH